MKKKQKQNSRNSTTEKVKSPQPKKPRGRPIKKPINESVDNLDGNNEYVQALAFQFPENLSDLSQFPENLSDLSQPKKPRGRPRKKPIHESVDNLDGNNECVQALAVQFPENLSDLLPVDVVSMDTHEHVTKKDSGRKRKGCRQGVSADNSVLTSSVKRTRLKDKTRAENFMHADDLPLLTQNENLESSSVNPIVCLKSGQDPKNGPLESSAASCLIPKDVALRRVVLCLAHNGKVSWDVKWRPSNVYDTDSKHRMGYLAFLLGSGALEVF